MRIATVILLAVFGVAVLSLRCSAQQYRARWTWPGMTEQSLREHLAGWPHFHDASGCSFDAMKRYHDGSHDQIGPVSGAELQRHNRGGYQPQPYWHQPRRFYRWR